MEFCDFVEFVEFKANHQIVIFALELKIETKRFARFSRSFVTAKYLDIIQWEEITRTIEKIAKNHMKINDTNDEGEFCTDEVNISWKIVPKDDSYIRFEKLRFTYVLGWIMQIRITRILPYSDRPITPDVIDIVPTQRADVVEYEPNNVSDQVIQLQSRYKASNIETSNVQAPEYSPRPLAVTEFATSKYTPSKIEVDNDIVPSSVSNDRVSRVAKSKKMMELFGSVSEDDNKDSKVEVVLVSSDERLREEKKTIKKRHLFSSEPKPESPHQKRQKKPKTEPNQSLLNSWVGKSDSPNNVTERKPSKNQSMTKKRNGLHPLELIDEAQMEKMQNFVEKSKQNETQKARRREELEDLDVLDCNDVKNEDLKRMIIDFMPNIRSLYANSNTSTRNKSYNPVLVTTSNVFTEAQISYVCQQIENQRDQNDRGYNEDILTEKILPEFIIHVFCEKFHLSKSEALQRLQTQDERRALFCLDETHFY